MNISKELYEQFKALAVELLDGPGPYDDFSRVRAKLSAVFEDIEASQERFLKGDPDVTKHIEGTDRRAPQPAQEALKPCPFCKSAKRLLVFTKEAGMDDAMQCMACNLYLPITVAKWNEALS